MFLNTADNATGGSLPNRVDQMLVYFSQYVQKVIEAQKKAGDGKTEQIINIDTIGFSRGAASARLFASKLEYLLMQTYSDKDEILDPSYQAIGVSKTDWGRLSLECLLNNKIKINFRFMGVWDSVPAFGVNPDDDMTEFNDKHMNIDVSERFKAVAHAVAVNDHREGFKARSIYDDVGEAQSKDGKTYKTDEAGLEQQTNTRIERGFMGSHSDVGGGYSDGDLSDVSLMWMIDQAKKSGIDFNNTLIAKREYNVVSNPIVHDSTGNDVTFNGRSGIVGPYFDPGRDFAWANTWNTNNQVNQHLTGMTAAEASDYLSGYAFSKEQLEKLTKQDVEDYLTKKQIPFSNVKGMDIDQMKAYLAQNNWFVSEIKSFPNMPMHLKLNWKDTLDFQNQSLIDAKTGKFEKFLALEQEFARDPDCKPKEIFGSCKALTEYQELKSNDVTKTATIVYSTDPEKNEIIQTQKYLDWIKTNYGTELTFNLDLNKGTKK